MATSGARYGRSPPPNAREKCFPAGFGLPQELWRWQKSRVQTRATCERVEIKQARGKKKQNPRVQGKGNERAQNKKRNGESGQESAETQQKEGTAPHWLRTESCSSLGQRQSYASCAREPASLGATGTGQGTEEPPVALLEEGQRRDGAKTSSWT